MMKTLSKRWFALAMVLASGIAMMAVSFDAEARRFGGGFSSGRQSTNVTQQQQAVTAPAATARAASSGAAASGGARWLGPIAGIAAAFGLAAILAHLGLTGALADVAVLLLLASLAGLGLLFISRALRSNLQAESSGAANTTQRRQYGRAGADERAPMSGLLGAAPMAVPPMQPVVGDFFIPADFNQEAFIEEAKKQFVAIQKAWDTMDFDGLQARLTDEMYAQYAGKMAAHGGTNRTDVVMLNATLLGIEKLADGYLGSVRFSGMIREDDALEAAAFEEVWNLYKPQDRGWLLAGIQQLPNH